MKLHEMKPTPGSRKSKKRIGRGDKTAGRGENGQKSRAGYSKKIGFEGGQNPLYRTLPKRGFNNINSISYTIVNIDKIADLKLKEITPEILIEKRVIKSSYGLLKILGDGSLKDPIVIKAHKFSKSAVKTIESVGGKIEIIK